MKKNKRNAILIVLIFILALAAGAYTAIFGLASTHSGKAENIKLGLDLAGGVSITYEVVDKDASSSDIDDTVYKLQKRVDTYSTEGEVYKDSTGKRISVEIPGVENANEILEGLGSPGALEFLDDTGYQAFVSGGEYTPLLTGSDISTAQAGIDSSGAEKEYVVQLSFTSEGQKKFYDATSANVGKRIYIVYDGQVQSAPNVKEAISSPSAQIDGMESYEEAEALATTIRIGALPLELKTLQSNIVGAKLGQEAVSTTLKAGLIGVMLVCVFMIIIYLVPGVVASFALFAYVILMLLCLNLFEVTLTLPGLAGIVLSIGMAVDANVIIFTRIKEEIAAGNSVKTAIDSGFHKALSAILDGNITTLIAAAVLYFMGTGAIKGFAQTLAIGIILSMLTALFITKYLLKSAYELGIVNAKCYGSAKITKVINYVKASKFCMVGSLVVIILGFVFLPINKSNIGNILNYSIEFSGGTSITATFDKAYTLEEAEKEIRPVIAEAAEVSEGTVQLQTVQDENQVVIKLNVLDLDHSAAVEDALYANFDNITEYSAENISGTLSSEMKRDAVIAVVIATIMMLIYIAFRFKDVRFGASAVIALLHDVLVVFTLYSVARLSVGNTFIACMLTIVGYSINATIIIFDRIRENMKEMDVKKVGLDGIVNTSISQTFTRTIYTSLTTFVMVLVLYIMGVPSIKEFAITLMAGIVCGAYSSVCITGPMWLLFKKKLVKKESK